MKSSQEAVTMDAPHPDEHATSLSKFTTTTHIKTSLVFIIPPDWFVSILAFLCVIGAFLCVYRYFLGNRLVDQAAKLRSQIAKIRQDFPELEQKRSDIVASALGDMGIEGIMDELGIDPKLLNNPLVKGLVDKYAPRLMETLNKGANKSQGQEGQLL
jgi:hypothetical protein